MPYLGSTLFVSSLVVAILASSAGWFLLVRALWPGFVTRAAHNVANRPFLCASLGFPAAAAAALASALLLGAAPGPVRALGVVAAAVLIGVALSGMAGIAEGVGVALGAPLDRPWAAVLRGAIVLELALLVPLLGWFLVLPIAVAVGTGGAVLALAGAGRARAPAPGIAAETRASHAA